MNKGILFSKIRKNSVKHIIAYMIPLFVAFMLIYIIPYEDVFWPEVVYSSSEAANSLEDGAKYVYIKPEVIYYTGYDLKIGDKTKGSYYYELVDANHCYFFLMEEATDTEEKSYKQSGFLVKAEETDGLFDNMLEILSRDINWNYYDLKNITSSTIFVQANHERWIYYVSFLGLIVVAFVCMYVVCSNMIYCLEPYLHPAVRRIKKYVKYSNDEDMELDIDYQLVSDVADAGGMYITDKFFVHMGSFYIDIIPISEIVFVYKHSQRIGMPGAHFKLTYTVHILGKKRFKCSCPGKKKEDADLILDKFNEIYPEIINGYTEENKKEALKKIKKNT